MNCEAAVSTRHFAGDTFLRTLSDACIGAGTVESLESHGLEPEIEWQRHQMREMAVMVREEIRACFGPESPGSRRGLLVTRCPTLAKTSGDEHAAAGEPMCVARERWLTASAAV